MMRTLNDELLKQRNLVETRQGKTLSFACICLHTLSGIHKHVYAHTHMRSALKHTHSPSQQKVPAEGYAEKLAAEWFSSLTLSPDLCSTCRGCAVKGAVLFWGGKNHQRYKLDDYLKGLATCTHSLLQMYCIKYRYRSTNLSLPQKGCPDPLKRWAMATLLIIHSHVSHHFKQYSMRKEGKKQEHYTVLTSTNAVTVDSSHLSCNYMLNTLTHAQRWFPQARFVWHARLC